MPLSEEGHLHLLHMDDIVAIFSKIGANLSGILGLRSIYIIRLQNGRETCDIETQSGKLAAGARRMSRRREEDTKHEKRPHLSSLPLIWLQGYLH